MVKIADILKVIEEKCLKLQFEDAELLAEYLCTKTELMEVSHYTHGRILILQSKYAASIPILSKCTSAKGKYFLANSYFEVGEYTESLEVLSKLREQIIGTVTTTDDAGSFLQFSLKSSDITNLLAKVYRAIGNVEKSAILSREAFEADRYMMHSFQQAITLSKIPIQDEVISRLHNENLWNTSSNSPYIYCESKAKRKKKSSIDTNANQHHNSDFLSALMEEVILVGVALKGYYKEVFENLNCDIWYCRSVQAFCLYEIERYQEAKEVYLSIFDWNPFYDQIFMETLPSVLWHLKDVCALTMVAKSWQKDLSLQYLSLLAFGNLFSLKEDHQASIRAFHQAAELRPTRPLPLILIGFEFLLIEDYQAASEYFLCALQRDPLNGRASLGLGIVHYRQNETATSEGYLLMAAKLLPKNYIPFIYLASLYSKDSKTLEKSLVAAEQALILNENNSKALFIKASILSSFGKNDESLLTLQRLKSVAPTEVEVHIKMGEVLLKSGNAAAALKSFNTAHEIEPNNPKVVEALDRYQQSRSIQEV